MKDINYQRVVCKNCGHSSNFHDEIGCCICVEDCLVKESEIIKQC